MGVFITGEDLDEHYKQINTAVWLTARGYWAI